MNLQLLIPLILLNLPIYNFQLCGLNPPRNETDCFDNVKDDFDCCYIYNDTNAACIQIKNSYELNTSQLFEYENQDYQFKCGLLKFRGQIGTECGKTNPMNISDCNESSTNNNYCCFYNTTSLKKCFWLGEEFSGEIFEFVQTDRYGIKCASFYFQMNFSYLILLSIVFLLI